MITVSPGSPGSDPLVNNPRLEAFGFWPQDELPASQFTPIANRIYYKRFVCRRTATVTDVAFGVKTAAGANDSCDVAILSSTGSRLASTGATAGKMNSTGAKSIPLTASIVLTAGVEYFTAYVTAVGGTSPSVVAYDHADNSVSTVMCATVGTIDKYMPHGIRDNGSAVIGGSPGIANGTSQAAMAIFLRGT